MSEIPTNKRIYFKLPEHIPEMDYRLVLAEHNALDDDGHAITEVPLYDFVRRTSPILRLVINDL